MQLMVNVKNHCVSKIVGMMVIVLHLIPVVVAVDGLVQIVQFPCVRKLAVTEVIVQNQIHVNVQ